MAVIGPVDQDQQNSSSNSPRAVSVLAEAFRRPAAAAVVVAVAAVGVVGAAAARPPR